VLGLHRGPLPASTAIPSRMREVVAHGRPTSPKTKRQAPHFGRSGLDATRPSLSTRSVRHPQQSSARPEVDPSSAPSPSSGTFPRGPVARRRDHGPSRIDILPIARRQRRERAYLRTSSKAVARGVLPPFEELHGFARHRPPPLNPGPRPLWPTGPQWNHGSGSVGHRLRSPGVGLRSGPAPCANSSSRSSSLSSVQILVAERVQFSVAGTSLR